MQKIKLTISYDGTAYHGWQKQKSGHVTVEETIEKSLSEITGVETDIQGASRTDAGVHALGQVAHFETDSSIKPEGIMGALNGKLPEDIRIMKAEVVHPEFHARFNAKKKLYRYSIYCGEVSRPLKRLYEHRSKVTLDVEKMREAAKYLVGEKDFCSFEKDSDPEKNSVREILGAEIMQKCREINIEISGTGFLYQMVRAAAGTLVEIGRGKRSPESMQETIEARDRNAAGPTLPAKGLCLVEIEY